MLMFYIIFPNVIDQCAWNGLRVIVSSYCDWYSIVDSNTLSARSRLSGASQALMKGFLFFLCSVCMAILENKVVYIQLFIPLSAKHILVLCECIIEWFAVHHLSDMYLSRLCEEKVFRSGFWWPDIHGYCRCPHLQWAFSWVQQHPVSWNLPPPFHEILEFYRYKAFSSNGTLNVFNILPGPEMNMKLHKVTSQSPMIS